MRTNLTRNDVTQELIDLVTEYLARRVIAEVTRQEVDAVQRDVLQDIVVMSTAREHPHGRSLPSKRITDPDLTYLCRDESAMTTYYQAIDTKLREAGIKPDDMELDYCPALVAECNQVEAEWAILDEAAKMLDIHTGKGELNSGLLCCKNGLETRQEFIDLTVSLVLSL